MNEIKQEAVDWESLRRRRSTEEEAGIQERGGDSRESLERREALPLSRISEKGDLRERREALLDLKERMEAPPDL